MFQSGFFPVFGSPCEYNPKTRNDNFIILLSSDSPEVKASPPLIFAGNLLTHLLDHPYFQPLPSVRIQTFPGYKFYDFQESYLISKFNPGLCLKNAGILFTSTKILYPQILSIGSVSPKMREFNTKNFVPLRYSSEQSS